MPRPSSRTEVTKPLERLPGTSGSGECTFRSAIERSFALKVNVYTPLFIVPNQ